MANALKNLLNRLADHPTRHILQNMVLSVPGAKSIQKRRYHTGAMNNPELMTNWAKKVIEDATEAGITIDGVGAAEVGPGHSLGVAICLLSAGAGDVAVVDVKKFVDPSQTEPFLPVLKRWRQMVLSGILCL